MVAGGGGVSFCFFVLCTVCFVFMFVFLFVCSFCIYLLYCFFFLVCLCDWFCLFLVLLIAPTTLYNTYLWQYKINTSYSEHFFLYRVWFDILLKGARFVVGRWSITTNNFSQIRSEVLAILPAPTFCGYLGEIWNHTVINHIICIVSSKHQKDTGVQM